MSSSLTFQGLTTAQLRAMADGLMAAKQYAMAEAVYARINEPDRGRASGPSPTSG